MKKLKTLLITFGLTTAAAPAFAYIQVQGDGFIGQTATHYVLGCLQADKYCATVWVAGGSVWVQMGLDGSVWQVTRSVSGNDAYDEERVATALYNGSLYIER